VDPDPSNWLFAGKTMSQLATEIVDRITSAEATR
jgi:hypothetical protein